MPKTNQQTFKFTSSFPRHNSHFGGLAPDREVGEKINGQRLSRSMLHSFMTSHREAQWAKVWVGELAFGVEGWPRDIGAKGQINNEFGWSGGK
jgi:hypothetical protein